MPSTSRAPIRVELRAGRRNRHEGDVREQPGHGPLAGDRQGVPHHVGGPVAELGERVSAASRREPGLDAGRQVAYLAGPSARSASSRSPRACMCIWALRRSRRSRSSAAEPGGVHRARRGRRCEQVRGIGLGQPPDDPPGNQLIDPGGSPLEVPARVAHVGGPPGRDPVDAGGGTAGAAPGDLDTSQRGSFPGLVLRPGSVSLSRSRSHTSRSRMAGQGASISSPGGRVDGEPGVARLEQHVAERGGGPRAAGHGWHAAPRQLPRRWP